MSKLTLELLTFQEGIDENASYIEFDLVNHVHKRIETFTYLDDIKPSAVALDYFESTELDSRYNVSIVDRSYNVATNSVHKLDSRSGFAKLTGIAYSSEYSELLITNQSFVDEFNKERPLFWRHELNADVVDVQLESVQWGNTVPVETGYVVDLAERAIFTNYQNYFDQDTGSYRVYFVTSTTSTGTQYRELLSPVPVVREASWEDIDPETGDLYDDLRVFTKEKNTSGYTYYFNQADTFWIKPLSKSLIRIRPPAGRKSDEPWYLRISAGDLTTIANSSTHRYWLPEYFTQPFQPSFPYIFSAYNKMLYVSDRIISATRGSLAIDPDTGRHLMLYIYDYEGNLLKVWTTNSTLNGLRYSNTKVFYEYNKILCWDNQSGLIALTESILPAWQFYAEYSYAADDLELTSINLNPIQNKDLLNQTIVLYVVPDADTDDRGLHYLIVEADNTISYTSQSRGFSYPNLQLRHSSGVFNSNNIIGMPYSSESDMDNFLMNYAVGFENTNAYLILGEINLLDRAIASKSLVYDVREQGDSLVNKTSKTYAKNPRTLQSVFGYGEDGATIPMNNVVVIQAPLDILTSYGGVLEENQAKDLLKKYMSAGTYPIIEWTYPWSETTLDVSTANAVTLSWTWEGPDFEYRVYRRRAEVTEWELLATYESGIPLTFTYEDTDVVSDDLVYYEVRIANPVYEYPAPYYSIAKVK